MPDDNPFRDNPFRTPFVDPADAPGAPQPTQPVRQAVNLGASIDTERGAPANVRAAVGAAPKAIDRLATLRQFFPDAQPYLDENFIFTDPETGRPTLYNPPGFDVGDTASIGPEIGEMVAGGAAATAVAVPAVAAAIPTAGASLVAIPAAAGAGAVVGRSAVQASAAAFGDTINTQTIGEALGDAGVTFLGNAVGQRVGDLIGAGIRGLFGPVARRAFTGTNARAVRDAFRQFGVRPLAGAMTGNRSTQIIEQGLASTPGGSSTMQRAANEALESLGAANEDLARRYANTPLDDLLTAEGIGEAVQQGTGAASGRFTRRQEVLYNGVYSQLPADGLMLEIPALRGLRQQLLDDLARAPESRQAVLRPALDELDNVIADFGNQGLPFGALREIRTDVGQIIGDPVLVGQNSAQRRYLQRVYAALTDDMNLHALRAGGPKARHDLAVADRYTRRYITERIPFINQVIDSGTPEQVFRMVFGGAQNPGQASQLGGSVIRQTRQNLSAEEWDVIAGSMFRRMGLARPAHQGDTAVEAVGEVFSPATFMTRWNSLSPEARVALWGGTRYSELIPELNAFSVANNALVQAEKMANTSGTTRTFLVGGTLTGAGTLALTGSPSTAAAAVAGSVVAPYAAAKLMTNPAFVRWLTGTMNTARAGSPIGGRLGRLAAIGVANPEIRAEVQQYIDGLRTLEPFVQQPPTPAVQTPPAAAPQPGLQTP